jgi:NO-binding membrane sensor protein with MHYT domain/nitrogen-specific signal transduction histidine kinase/DNA-binding NarL/FixJ family response regulator
MAVTGTYNPHLVELSILVAAFASYTALDLGGRVAATQGVAPRVWLVAAAIAMGGGIWSMHFIAMLAFNMPIPMSYDIGLTTLSLVVAIFVTGVGFYFINRQGAPPLSLVFSGIFMGLGIAAMHYIGMAAMRGHSEISYDFLFLAISLVIAIGASTAALWLAFRTTDLGQRLVAAGVMGLAISGMHYSAMRGTTFVVHGPVHEAQGYASLDQTNLALVVAGITFVILAFALIASLQQENSERRRAEKALRRSEAYLDQAQAASHTGSFSWNAVTDEVYWSAETFRIYEFDGAVPPELARIVRQTHPGDRDFHQQILDRARQEKKDFDLEYRLLMPDGSVKHLEVVAHALADELGDLEFVGAVMDVTQRKRAEEAQRVQERERDEMQRQLQQAAKMEAIGRLAGGIAHDFNNILGAILGFGELVQINVGKGSAVRHQIDQVMHAGMRGKALVDRILAFSRSGVGERVPVHVQSVVEEALELLAASLPADVRLETRFDAADLAVVGDATQFHQVVMNLCTNAVHAMERAGVLTVLLERLAVDERRLLSHGTLSAGGYVRLLVSDTGGGIPPAVFKRMFDPFFTTKRVGDGTGLGLALVHSIVADFRGVIDVETKLGLGTSFTIWLPAAGPMPTLPAEPVGELPRGNGETVMIVDDERALVALAEETLAGLGYEPVGFDSSIAALQGFRAEPNRFDLVITDETMPDLTGTELASEIRRLRPEISIILMSGFGGEQLSERALTAGVIDVLRKPLVRRNIAESVARAMHARNQRMEPSGGRLAALLPQSNADCDVTEASIQLRAGTDRLR